MISSCFLNEIPLKPLEKCCSIKEVEILPSLKSLLDITTDKKDKLLAIGVKNKKKATGNFIGLAKINKKSKKSFLKYMSNILSKSKKDYYTKVFNSLIKKKYLVSTIDVNGKYWREVDTKKDYYKLKKEKNAY